ncbi:unnamed protein product [Protopolystoma xenopodis]|uniref:Uncharacterized protein n=1 Tax=Protopolystoma xenopodis TaxID=117903 RepID=A0A3S5B192_9PLAT|nr:unnamed protein product [Protopolystoma xenopodis]
MFSGSADVHHMMTERSARSHRGRRTVSRGFLRTFQKTKFQGDPPVISGEANLRIPSARLLKPTKCYAFIKHDM